MAKSMLFRKTHVLIDGRKHEVYEPTFHFEVKPSLGSPVCAEVHIDGYMDADEAAEFLNDCSTDGSQPDTISITDWERIHIGEDVFVTTDVLRKALKEYFDKILTTNDKE
jgi:hypothetical protein